MKFPTISNQSVKSCAVLVTLAIFAPLARAQALYGVTFFDNELISINTTTGEGTLIAALSMPVSAYGLAFRGSQLYTFSPDTDSIHTIDTNNGTVGPAININVGNLAGEGDLAFRSDGMGFLATVFSDETFTPRNDLFMFDIVLGTSTLIGSTSMAIDGLAFVGNTLYALSQGDVVPPSLYIVNQFNGELTEVGSLDVSANSLFSGLGVWTDGSLYAAVDDQLYIVDTTSGLASKVGAADAMVGFSGISGLATAIPEPSAYTLMVGATVLVVALRRRRPAR